MIATFALQHNWAADVVEGHERDPPVRYQPFILRFYDNRKLLEEQGGNIHVS